MLKPIRAERLQRCSCDAITPSYSQLLPITPNYSQYSQLLPIHPNYSQLLRITPNSSQLLPIHPNSSQFIALPPRFSARRFLPVSLYLFCCPTRGGTARSRQAGSLGGRAGKRHGAVSQHPHLHMDGCVVQPPVADRDQHQARRKEGTCKRDIVRYCEIL
eukprot:SAG31_NODE_2394_length_5793_cov_2.006674_5_plen_160_part_00